MDLRMVNRNLGTVGVINIVLLSGLENIGETFFVLFGKTISRAFGRSSFEVVQIPGGFLEFLHSTANMIQNIGSKFNSRC